MLKNVASQMAMDMIAQAKQSVVRVQSGGRGVGTGVMWRSQAGESEVLTNAHVVADTSHIRIQLNDDREFDATVTARSPELDLAMLKINIGNLTPALVADSTRLRVGELVFAIGNPWGARDVVTQGIVSGFGKVAVQDRASGAKGTAEYVRSDVALAPGNSGGPLLNASGEVVGINAMILGGDLSVAIPSHVAAEWVAGQPDRPVRLGIVVQPVDVPGKMSQVKRGLLVMNVEADGPAASALMIGDVVLGVSGQMLESPDSLITQVSKYARSRGQVQLNILRGGLARDVDIPFVSTARA